MGSKKFYSIEEFTQYISEAIKSCLRKNFPEISSDDQKEIAQEVNLKIWKALSIGKNIKNLRSYLWKVAFTTALDLINERRKYVSLERTSVHNANYVDRLEDISAELLLEKKESRTTLMEAIERLSQNRRIVIKLSLTGMTVKEIAEFFGWTNSKVNHLYYRGLEDLKKRIYQSKEEK